jgi:hypothetical protein
MISFIPGMPGSPDRPYSLKNTTINNGLNTKTKYVLCHLFDRVDLVNPDHLFLLSYHTQQQHTFRTWNTVRSSITSGT